MASEDLQALSEANPALSEYFPAPSKALLAPSEALTAPRFLLLSNHKYKSTQERRLDDLRGPSQPQCQQCFLSVPVGIVDSSKQYIFDVNQ